MEDRAFGELLSLAGTVTDSLRHKRVHILSEVIIMAVCSVLGGAEGWLDVLDFCKDYQKDFRDLLTLPGGIPSHDTFGRIFSLLTPSELERVIIEWTATLHEQTNVKLLSLDGNILRQSFARGWDHHRTALLHQQPAGHRC